MQALFAGSATYAVLYLAVCLLLLRLLLPAQQQWRWCGGSTPGLGFVRPHGGAQQADRQCSLGVSLSRQLLDFIVSRCRVAGLYVLSGQALALNCFTD
jgi:hypothetical protein